MTIVEGVPQDHQFPREELTALAVSFPPEEESLAVELLSDDISPEDTVILVTANTPPADVIERYERQFAGPDTPSLAIVDTTAGQTFKDSYHDVEVIGIPGIEDLTRTTIAISDLADEAPDDGVIHLVVPDLSPFIAMTKVEILLRVFETLFEQGTISGTSLVAFDYKAHSTETVSRVLEMAAVVLWVDRKADGSISVSTVER